MDLVIVNENNKQVRIPTKIVNDVDKIKALLSKNTWKVFELLSKKELYPAKIAKELNLHEQTVYYSIKQLKKSELIKIAKTEEKHGALAKYYTATIKSLTLIPALDKLFSKKENIQFTNIENEMSVELAEYFKPFIEDSKLNAHFIVGSPDPHGPLKARARDSYLVGEITAFFASFVKILLFPLIKLDTSVSSLKDINSNLIVIGGPIVNKISEQLQEYLPIKIKEKEGHWAIYSECSDKTYFEDEIGLIQKIKHPFFEDKSILFIAGNRVSGTKAAILAFSKNLHEIIKPNLFNESNYAKIVEGIDLDGDGYIDEVEIRE